MNKHTKEKWEIQKSYSVCEEVNFSHKPLEYCFIWGKNRKTNARLIASAPELLEACKKDLEICSNGKCSHGYAQYNCSLCSKLKQAITKAEAK